MRFVVRFLRRGRIQPWRDVMNQAPEYGDLRNPQAFTLTGFERADGVEYGQVVAGVRPSFLM